MPAAICEVAAAQRFPKGATSRNTARQKQITQNSFNQQLDVVNSVPTLRHIRTRASELFHDHHAVSIVVCHAHPRDTR